MQIINFLNINLNCSHRCKPQNVHKFSSSEFMKKSFRKHTLIDSCCIKWSSINSSSNRNISSPNSSDCKITTQVFNNSHRPTLLSWSSLLVLRINRACHGEFHASNHRPLWERREIQHLPETPCLISWSENPSLQEVQQTHLKRGRINAPSSDMVW